MEEKIENQAKSDNLDLKYINKKDSLINIFFYPNFKPIKKLGEGSFGKVYKVESNNKYYAMKLESKKHSQGLLESEATIMTYLKGSNIPKIELLTQNEEYNILIMELMGKSLEELINIHKNFSIKTVCMLAYQMINILQFIHEKHIIHRDIKPDNFVMGLNENNAHLFIIDFGLSKKFRSSKQGIKAKGKEERYRKIFEKKKEISSEELCKGFPIIFQNFVYYVKNLDYLEEPDYENLKNMFIGFINNELNENFDFIYDWTTIFDIKKRKDFNNDLYSYYQFSEKSVNRRQTESLIYKKKINKEVTTTNGNNLTLYRTSPTEGNNILNNSKYNNSNINVKKKKKKLDDNASSRCCIM